MYNQYGASQMPQEELHRIVTHYQDLCVDETYQPHPPPGLVTLPFIEVQFDDQINRLPFTMPTIL